MEPKITQKSLKRHSIGKVLRHKCMSIVSEDEITHSDERGNLPVDLKNYLDYLIANGLQYNRSQVSLSIMDKYGISYIILYTIGLIAKEVILCETEIARIPQSLMLDTRKVFSVEQLYQIIDQNQDFFVPDGKYLVEDRVLLLGLIYHFQNGENSEYYHMINNFSKDITTIAFYETDQIQQFRDYYLDYWAKEQSKFFSELAKFYMEQIVPKYPLVFINPQDISVEIIRWLYIHIVTRTFGIGDYVTFVPFAEFLNHGYISSYGEFINSNNQPPIISEEGDYQSNQSYSSSEDLSTGTQDLGEDYLSDFKNDIDTLDISQNLTSCIGLKNEQTILLASSSINAISDIIMQFINEFDLGINLNSIIFAKMLEKFKKLEVKYQVHPEEMSAQMQRMEKMLEFLLFLVEQQPKKHAEENYNNKIFKGMKQCKKMWDVDLEQKIVFIDKQDLNNQNISQVFRFSEYESVTKYESLTHLRDDAKTPDQKCFALKVNPKLYYHQPIHKGQQIFYQYGRLSNRSFLTRYGFAMEWNKYDSHYIRINCTLKIQQISKEACLFMHQFKIQNRQAFKIKYTHFCFELLSYFRALEWSLELDSLESIFNPRNLVTELNALRQMNIVVKDELCQWNSIRSTNQESIQMVKNYHNSKCHLIEHNVKLIELALQFVEGLIEQASDQLDHLRLKNPMEFKILGSYFKDLQTNQVQQL